MKRILLLFCLSLGCFLTHLPAQVSFGIGPAFGTKADNGGFLILGAYDLNESFRLQLNYIKFGSKAEFSEYKPSYEFNVNGQYKVIEQDAFYAYGLAGINYTKYISSKLLGSPIDYSKTGWNIGIGGQVEVAENIAIAVEFKSVFNDPQQFVLSLTGIYTIY